MTCCTMERIGGGPIRMFLFKNILDNELRKEQLRDLNENLERKVSEQTAEIKKSYNLEKQAKEELQSLDQNKNDFIIVTQHHLRTPLTQIRWYISSMLSEALEFFLGLFFEVVG